MTAAAILTRLRDLGVTAKPEGDMLRLRPGSRVPPELLAEVKVNKPALLALLAAKDAPPAFPAASPDQAEAERQDRAAIAAEGAPIATAPVDLETLAAWEAELAELLAAAPAQTVTASERARVYFAAEAKRRLGLVRHDRQAAGLLMGFWRRAEPGAAPATRFTREASHNS